MALPYFNYMQMLREEKEQRMLHRRHIRDLCNPFDMPNNEFVRIYRISKEIAMYICEEVGDQLREKRSDGLPVHIKVLTCVKLMGDGGYQRGTGQDHGLCIAQTTVSKYSKYLVQFCAVFTQRLLHHWIKFPGTPRQRQEITKGFEDKYGVPNVLGLIDCTHVAIFPPPLPHGVQYLNRKGIPTINVQLVADVNCKIIGVNARYPGRVHDQYIFNNSKIKDEMKKLYDNRIGEYFLLGDSGYALEPWLMTPILHATPNSPEDGYTQWHCLVRNGIERTNGYLKGIFRCLGSDGALHYSPEKALLIIYSCCILYNIMKHYRLQVDEPVVDPEDHEEVNTTPAQGVLLK